MKIYRPVKSNHRTQMFGENKLPWYKEWGMRGHNGEDWRAYHGEPVYHSGDWDGIAYTETDKDGGIGVDVISPKLGYKLRYWHLKSTNVYDGQEVKMGQLIGYADNTGTSTGDHLHWSLKKVDKNGKTLNRNNGYYGAVDFSQYFENEFVLDKLEVKEKLLTIIQLYHKLILLLKSRNEK